jgi:hypothetical protein
MIKEGTPIKIAIIENVSKESKDIISNPIRIK